MEKYVLLGTLRSRRQAAGRGIGRQLRCGKIDLVQESALEQVDRVEDVKHPIIREALALQHLETPQIEITTLADIPAGTGLGSSGSFTTALLKALYTHQRIVAHAQELAELACDIEIN